VGQVVNLEVGESSEPLIYFQGAFGGIALTDSRAPLS
jgi:hypothetical protein